MRNKTTNHPKNKNGVQSESDSLVLKLRKEEEVEVLLTSGKNMKINTFCQYPQKAWKNYEEDCRKIEDRLSKLASGITVKPRVERFLPYLDRNGCFLDLNLNFVRHLREHGRRLGSISYREVSGNGTLSEATHNSFLCLTYNASDIKSLNWWDHVIGVPIVLWPSIFMARLHLAPNVRKDFLDKYFLKTKVGPVWNWGLESGRFAGGNLGPRMLIGLVESFLRGSKHFLHFYNQLRRVLYKEVVLRIPYHGNGMRADGCLHQHNQVIWHQRGERQSTTILSQPYNNNYGKEFLKNAAIVMWILDETSFDLGEEIEEGVFASWLECQQWLFRGTTVEPSTVGRFIDSGCRITHTGGLDGVARTLKYLVRVNRHREEVVSALHRYYDPQPPSQEFSLQGNKHFFVSDLMAHHHQNFMSTVRLLSRRTCRPETAPFLRAKIGRNANGYFQGDGFLSILVSGKEFGRKNGEIFQEYDWARVPGTTCHYTKKVPQEPTSSSNKKHCYNDADFVGGVSSKDDGVAVMEYARPTIPLRAFKSWFFFHNVILCLGSGITLPTPSVNFNTVTTTLNQILYDGHYTYGHRGLKAEEGVTVRGSIRGRKWRVFDPSDQDLWIHHGAVGYVPLAPRGKIVLELSKNLVPSKKKSFISMFSLWEDHGRRPVNSTYAYVLLPGWTKEDTREFLRTPPIAILAQNSSFHAACSNPLKILGSVFFHEGCLLTVHDCSFSPVESICSNHPILILLKTLPTPLTGAKCPGGIKPLSLNPSNDLKMVPEIFKTFHQKLYSGSIKPEVANLYHPNQVWNSGLVLQLSVADPTQKLRNVKISLKIAKITYSILVSLPQAPRLGDSIIMCFTV